jgi:glucosamine--fructose-6-phosphate aminotransferase (isomerizing)
MSADARASVTWREAATSGEAVAAAVKAAADAPARIVEALHTADLVVFSGAGSSYHLAQAVAWTYRAETGRPAIAVPLSEILLRPAGVFGAGPERAVAVVISRSGETSEAVAVAERRRAAGAVTIAVTCRAESPLASLATERLVSPLGDERAIVMTRSFTSMLALLLGIVGRGATGSALGADLARLPDRFAALTGPEVERAWARSAEMSWSRIVVLGGGAAFGLAREACLKVTETSQLAASAYEPLEFRHGPISVCEPGVLVLGLPGGPGAAEERRVLDECADLGASTWWLDPAPDLYHAARLPLLLPPIQALALGLAAARGRDPDAPRHLSQVVVLE